MNNFFLALIDKPNQLTETSEQTVEKLDPDLEFGDRYGRIQPE